MNNNEVTVLYGDMFHEGNTVIIGVYTTFEKAKEAYFAAKEKGYTNIRTDYINIDEINKG